MCDEDYRSETTTSGQALQRPTVVLVTPRTMSNSDILPKESTAGNQANVGSELKECPVCGAVGLPERIVEHDCDEFLDCKEIQR